MILTVVFVVLMMFWLFCGSYPMWGEGPPHRGIALGGSIIPWLCVAILGWIVFGGDSAPSHRISQAFGITHIENKEPANAR